MYRTLVIDGLDAETFARLQSAARDRGVEIGALARTLLQQWNSAGDSASHELDSLAGTWSEEDAKAFDAATLGMRAVEPESWR